MRDLVDDYESAKWYTKRSKWFCGQLAAFAIGCLSTYVTLASFGAQPKLPSITYHMPPIPERATLHMSGKVHDFDGFRPHGEYWERAHEKREIRVFNGNPSYKSEFKGPPSLDVDDRWSQYWKVWSFWATHEEIGRTREDLEGDFVTIANADDNGTKYMVMNEAVHQLHCLYNLYRATNLGYYEEEGRFSQLHPQVWHNRVNHCLDILRQKLECDWDPSLITFRWTNETTPVPDYNVQHECRSRDSLLHLISSREIRETPSKAVEGT